MAKCVICGAELDENEAVCTVCGTLSVRDGAKEETQTTEDLADEKIKQKDGQNSEYDDSDIKQNKTRAVFCYIWVFVLIAVFDSKDSDFVRFHRRQGLLLLVTETLYAVNVYVTLYILRSFMPNLLTVIAGLALYAGFAFFIILMIKGIKAAARGQAKELPVIGRFAERMRSKE